VKGYSQASDPEDVTEEQVDALDMVDSDEYKAIISRYSNEIGKLNYALMNKDWIQFAAKSKSVGEMVAKNSSDGDILRWIVKSRATMLSGKKESLDDKQVDALIESLDEIDPRSAFKELKAFLRRRLAR
jgi:hypothetical protein